jgi:hypothetical protein
MQGSEHAEPWVTARDTAVLTLLYGCGLRISEALNLNRSEAPVPPNDDVLRITGKGGKVRLVPVLPAATKAIETYIALAPALEPHGPLFIGQRGSRLNARNIQLLMQRLRSALGLPDTATPHALRHSFATTCSAAAQTCAPYRSCSATPACPPRRSIPASTASICWLNTTKPTPALNPAWQVQPANLLSASMPVPLPDYVESDDTLPDRVDVAIIGGGIIGTCTAMELAERGLKVALFEKGRIAGEQSGRNWGWCRQMGRDSREMPLIVESLKLWRGMNQRVGADTGFTTCGIAYLEKTEDGIASREEWADRNARPHQVSSRIIRGEELDRVVPGASALYKGALFTESDGRAEPTKAAPAIANHIRTMGGQVFTGWAVRGIETEAGKISGIVTERGTVKCPAVVCAGGAWSRRFLGNLGLDLPQLITMSNVQA